LQLLKFKRQYINVLKQFVNVCFRKRIISKKL